MKKIILKLFVLISATFLSTHTIVCQESIETFKADSQSAKVGTLLVKADSLLAKMAAYVEKIDSIQAKLKNTVLFIQKKSSDTIFVSQIDSVKIHAYRFDSANFKINNGRLVGTYLFLKDTAKSGESAIFFNNKRIPLSSNRIEKQVIRYKLGNYSNTKERIYLKDYFLIYPNINAKGNDYYPTDTNISFKRNIPEYVQGIYSHQPKLENYIEYDILSDFEGLSADNPNGLVQFEGRASLSLNRRFCFRSNVRAIYNVVPFIQFNKIDENNRNLPVLIDSADQKKYLNTFNLWQYSNLTIGTKLNIIRWDSKNYRHCFFLDATSMIIRTSISDSIPTLTSSNVYSFIWGLAAKFRIYPINNVPFWGDFSLGISNLTLLNHEIKQQSKFMYRPNEAVSSIQNSDDVLEHFIFVPQIELSLKPENKTRYFVRVTFPTDLTKTKNNFLQIQIGISIKPKELNKYLNLKI